MKVSCWPCQGKGFVEGNGTWCRYCEGRGIVELERGTDADLREPEPVAW